MAGNVNNISRSFADNVNYLAELDNQYYRTGFIKRNGINVDGSIHRGIVKLNVFDLASKEHKNTEIYSADINGNADLINFFNNMKNTIIGLYPDVSINVSIVDGTNIIPDKNIDIQISSTNTILGQITVSIHTYVGLDVADYAKYTLTSGSENYIAVLPYLSQLDDSFNNAIFAIGENSSEIVNVSNNINSVTTVSSSINNVNTNALNIDSINTNANNIDNINNLGSRANDIDSIISNVIPNLSEILLADNNAIIATTKASEASASEASALSSKNSASASEANAFSYMNSAFQYKNNALASASNALLSEQNAASSEANASNSEFNASVSESNALTYRNETEVMKLAVETIYDTFDDRFLGVFNSDPALDNDGNVLISGALYFNPTSHEMKVYDVGTAIWYPLPQVYLSALLDVELTSLSTNNVLIWNGTKWINSNLKTINGLSLIGTGDLSISAGGGYAANVYLTTVASSTNGSYSQLSYAPEAIETILSATVNNNTVLIEDYIFDGDVQAQFIPAGEWGFHFHRKVDNTAADTKIVFEIYKRSNTGVETVLFNVSSLSIENTSFTREDLLITKPSFVVDTSDRIGLKVYATTTRTSNVNVHLKIGDGEACYFNTPLAIRHNQLRARDEVDSHTIGSITGLQTALDSKADQANTYTKTEVNNAIAALVDTAPATLDTLNELAAALGDDPNFATTVATNIGNVNTDLQSHKTNTSNPHGVTKAQVGLGNVDNTADANKNVLSATKLTTSRTISLAGDVTGSVSFDGSANASITATITDNVVKKVTSTDNAVVRFNGTTGEVQNSSVAVDDNGNVIAGGLTTTFTQGVSRGISIEPTAPTADSEFRVNGSGSWFTSFSSNTSGAGYGGWRHIDSSGSIKNWVYTAGQGETQFGTNCSERMRIDSAGNVGIGTDTSSGFKVDVLGGSGNGYRYSDGTTSVTLGVSPDRGQVGTLGAHRLDLLVGSVERVSITPSGNMLVGTTTDNGVDKLQVNGSITCNGITQYLKGLTTSISIMYNAGSKYIQIKTNSSVNNAVHLKISGFCYTHAQLMNIDCAAYADANFVITINIVKDLNGNGVTGTWYRSSDNYLCLELVATSTNGFSGSLLSIETQRTFYSPSNISISSYSVSDSQTRF